MRNEFGQFKTGIIPWNKSKKMVEYIDVPCLFCSKVNSVMPSRVKIGRGKFCNRKCKTEYQKGKSVIPPGWKHTDEAKKKIGAASLGHTLSEVSRKKISIKNSGDRNKSWRGGVSILNNEIRRSSAYKRWRKAVLQRDNQTCQECGATNGKFEVDHIKPFSLFPELRLDLANGRTLCVDCHRNTLSWGYKIVNKKDIVVQVMCKCYKLYI